MQGLNYFIFNGIDSRNLGVYAGCLDELVFPQKRCELITIPGRNGYIYDSDGAYDSYSRSIECVFEETANIQEIAKWLQGTGELILSNDLTKKYEVTIQNHISLKSVAIYYRNFELELEFQPFAESIKEYQLNLSQSNNSFDIGGTIDSKPILEIKCENNLTIMINDKELHIYNLKNQILEIDCKYQIMKIGTQNASNYVGGANLSEIKLKPKDNIVNIVGNFEYVKLKYRRVDLC